MNRFDQQLGYYDNNLGGIGSSLRKAFKKVGKGIKTGLSSINKHRLKIDDKLKPVMVKITPKPLRKVNAKIQELGREADKKGITKIAAAAVLSFVNPAIGGKLTALAISAAKASAVKSLQKSAVKDYTQYQTVKALDQINKDSASTLAEAVKSLPEFQAVIEQFRKEGYTDAEIAAHWVESRAFYEGATQAAADTVYPAVLQQTQQVGVPVHLQQPIAEQVSLDIGAKAAEQVQQEAKAKSGLEKALPLLLLVGLAAIGG